jgi:hypothetical protein
LKINYLDGPTILKLTITGILFLYINSAISAIPNGFNSINESNENGIIRGLVVDSTNGEVLAYCNVFIKELNIGTSTDIRGYFKIPSIPADIKFTLKVSFIGYQSKEIKFSVIADRVSDFKIELVPTIIELNNVEKIGKRVIEKNATDIGLNRMTIEDIEFIPKGVETDLFRSLQFITGVQSTGDVSARYFVRGGQSNENLVLLNGATIYYPFHAFGLFSIIDPDIISNVEFYKGGFTSEYGGRLSSVLNIITKDGNKKRFSGSASTSFLSGKALLEGPVPGGSIILTARKSYDYKMLNKFLNNINAPLDFYDIGGKINFSNPDNIKGGKMVIHGFVSKDVLDNHDFKSEGLNWSNKVFGFRWFQVIDSPIYFEISLSYSKFSGNVRPNHNTIKPKSNDVVDYSWDTNVNYMYDSKDEISVGIQLKCINTKLSLQNKRGLNSIIETHGTNISLFAKYKLLRFDNFGADLGTRINFTSLTQSSLNSFLFEPRLSLTYVVTPSLSLKAAWGIYSQEMTTLSDENEVISLFEPWIIVPSYLKVPKAIHYTVGLKSEISSQLLIDLQGYYKISQYIPILNEDKFYPEDPDFVSSDGESYGAEVMLNYNNGVISLTSSYSLGWSFITVNNLIYRPRYDVRHNLNILGILNFGDGWQFSMAWIYNSGYPFTQTMGFYEKLYFDDLFETNNYIGDYKSFRILAPTNLATLPQYHRLDIGISKKIELSFLKISINASIINVYNRSNIFYFQRDTGTRVNMLPFLPTATIKIEL